MRFVAIDTETTGMNKRRNGGDVSDGHRVIEIACVEILDWKVTGRYFHTYINPQICIDKEAILVHGISDDFLQDKPLFNDISTKIIQFIGDSTIVIHNAPFDIAFLDKEFSLVDKDKRPNGVFYVSDTLTTARNRFIGLDNSLKALAERLQIGLSQTDQHSALIDAQILARIFIALNKNPQHACR